MPEIILEPIKEEIKVEEEEEEKAEVVEPE